MTLDLLKRAEKGAELSAAEYDATLTSLETFINNNMLNLKSDFGAVGDGVANDTTPVSNALNSIMGSGRTLFVPKGTYLLTGWTAKSQSGPVNIIGEEGAIFKATTTSMFYNTDSGSFSVDIQQMTFDTWERVWRYGTSGAFAWNGTVPLFRWDRCTFKNFSTTIGHCLGTWAGQPGIIQQTTITNCRFENCFRCVAFEGGQQYNVLVHNNLVKDCLKEGFRFGANTLSFADNMQWTRYTFSHNFFQNIGATTGDNESHCIRCYGDSVLAIDNHVNKTFAPVTSTDDEAFYFKARFIIMARNVLIDAGAARGNVSFKGETRYHTSHTQPVGYGVICVDNIFKSTEPVPANVTRGPAIFSEHGDHIIARNRFIRIGGTAANSTVINFGSNDNANLDQSIIIENNYFENCATGAGSTYLNMIAKKGRYFIRNNVFQLTPSIETRPNYLIMCQTSVGATELHITDNGGDGGAVADVLVKSDNGADLYSVFIERNSWRTGAGALLDIDNQAPHEIHLIDNHLFGRALLTAQSNAPKIWKIRGNKGMTFTTTATTRKVVTGAAVAMATSAVGGGIMTVVGRGTTAADAYFARATRGIGISVFGSQSMQFEHVLGAITAGRITFDDVGATIEPSITPNSTASFTWDVDLDITVTSP